MDMYKTINLIKLNKKKSFENKKQIKLFHKKWFGLT